MNVAEDGSQWKDALGQAAHISTDAAVDTVFINLGANDVCHSFGRDYTGDLQQISQDIDNTLSYLLSFLPIGAKIYWTGTPNIVDLRNVMAGRRHNYIFRSCQAFWLNLNSFGVACGREMADFCGFREAWSEHWLEM